MTNISRPVVGIDIYGDLMAWYDSAIASAGLYAMNLSGGEVIDLVTNHCVCYGDPELHGRLVVYEGWVGYSRDIWMVNVDTLVQERLVEHPGPQFDPAFDGQWVVWADGRNDPSSDAYGSRVNADIYGLDMETRTIRPICNDPSVQLFPDVRDGFVVWMDWRNAAEPNNWQDFDANTDVYLFELSTGREIRVTSDAVDAALPRVWQRRVFFVGTDLTGQTAIFVVDLDEAGLLDPA